MTIKVTILDTHCRTAFKHMEPPSSNKCHFCSFHTLFIHFYYFSNSFVLFHTFLYLFIPSHTFSYFITLFYTLSDISILCYTILVADWFITQNTREKNSNLNTTVMKPVGLLGLEKKFVSKFLSFLLLIWENANKLILHFICCKNAKS